MAITYGAATSAVPGAGSTSQAITKPSGVVTGDVVVITVATYNTTSPAASTVTGFTQIATVATGEMRGTMLARRIDGTEGASFTIVTGTNWYLIAGAIRVIGVSTTGTILDARDATPVTKAATETAPTLPALTTTVANSSAIAFVATNTQPTDGDPTTWTNRQSYDAAYLEVHTKAMATAGSTGTAVAQLLGTTQYTIIVAAFKQAGSTASTGTIAVSETADTIVASGTSTPPARTGTIAASETSDTAVLSGTASPPGVAGTMSATETADTAVASGTVAPPPATGTIAATEAADTPTIAGTASAPAATAPGAPTGLAVKPGDTEFWLGWTAPASDGGSSITGYLLEHNVNAAGWTTHTATTGTTRTYAFPQGYALSDSVQFRASAINSVGTGTATAASTAAVSVERLFPVSVGSGVFDDQNGDPWLMVGDTPWSIVVQLSDAEIRDYLDHIQSLGVNTILYNSVEHFYSDNAPNNIDGVAPFTGAAFQTGLTEAYWRRVDFMIEYARVLGVTVIDCPAYLGYPGTEEGWDTEVNAASNANMTTFGNTRKTRTLAGGGGTYGAQPHIIYLAGHDSEPSSTEILRYDNLIAAIKGPSQLVTVGAMSEDGGTTGGNAANAWAGAVFSWDFNTIYLYDGNIAQDTRTIIAADGPAIFAEGRYPGEAGYPGLWREQTLASIGNGAIGALHGRRPTWLFDTGWYADLLASESHDELGVAAVIMSTAAVQAEAAVVDSTSTFITTGRSSGTTEAGVRFGPNGALIYTPTDRALTVDLTELDGEWSTVNIVRYDPTSGASSTLSTGQATTATGYSIPTQGSNAGGDDDWLFVVSGNTPLIPASTGTIAVSDAADTGVMSGTASAPPSSGTISVSDAADGIVATGTASSPPSTGTVSVSEAADTAVVTGTASAPPATGTLGVSEASDAAVITGEAAAEPGTMSATEAADTAVITGTATPPPSTGTIAVTEASDTAAITGTASVPGAATGTIAVAETGDTITGTGTVVSPPATGTIAVSETADTIVMYDTAVIAHGSAGITVTAPASSITVTAPTATITVTKE